jgi:hypothetical protein
MNEFTAKKLGEVLAFTRVEIDTLTRGRDALVQTLGEERLLDIEEKNKLYSESIMKMSTEAGMIDTTLTKASATEDKFKKMRDMYVGDQWDNATELMEWSGFFEGATIVHWALVKGCAEGMNDENFMTLAEEAMNWHHELLELSEEELTNTGTSKTTTA